MEEIYLYKKSTLIICTIIIIIVTSLITFSISAMVLLGPSFNNQYQISFDQGSVTYDSIKKFNQARKNKVFDEGKKLNLLYELPAKYDSPVSSAYSMISADITKAYDECMLNAVTGKQPIEKAIETYRATVKAIGGQMVIDEANAALGLTSNFKY